MTAKKSSKEAASKVRSTIDDMKSGPKPGAQANRALSTMKSKKPKKKK